jgi:hypothetical protein
MLARILWRKHGALLYYQKLTPQRAPIVMPMAPAPRS